MSQYTIEAARAFESRGHKIVPLWGLVEVAGKLVCRCRDGALCESPGKHPMGKWRENPSRIPSVGMNYAVVLGPGVVVIDVDDREHVPDLSSFFGTKVPSTYTVNTRKGYHAYFTTPEPLAQRVPFRPGVDVKTGPGGYVVGPYSLRVDGLLYEPTSNDPMAEIPQTVRYLIGPPRVELHRTTAIPQHTSLLLEPTVRATVEQVASLQSGERNSGLFLATIGLFRKEGVGLDSIRDLVEASQLPKFEAERTVLSAIRSLLSGEQNTN